MSATWGFLSNHTHVLVCIAREPGTRIRDIADCVGITERAATRILNELEQEGYITRHRLGARNYYELHPDRPLRHTLESGRTIGDLVGLLTARVSASQAA